MAGRIGLPTGLAVVLTPHDDHLEVGGVAITYKELARWIQQHYAIVQKLMGPPAK